MLKAHIFPRHCLAILGVVVGQFAHGAPAADPFAEGVRSTPWLLPADQQKTFKLPPGFEIQLVAAEPDIHKPMNLAFDAKGRLWVTTSIEYPFAAPTNKPGRDRLMIFEDFGPDGRARKVTEFADGLNIPIGVYPFQSVGGGVEALRRAHVGAARAAAAGRPVPPASPAPPATPTWKAIVWSIPHLWLMEDTDGDGRADDREPLYGPFDYTRDTHGNQASFRRGFDGWLYCTHGYNNDSRVMARDGSSVHLHSGNTYRIRLDGSRIEHHTHGQVNPYGLAFDELGNLFSSDCHSEPLYQLLAGGYYPSFGKPHDGLGFAPTMMEKVRGSTAIDGVSIYADNLWPEEFHGNTFFGDVMASRVFRDRLTDHGSTRIARALPDFVVTDDPWFRPVDTCLGPDGALYIADFYNRIIGHYEVPLTHPGRDRTSGRIWRVVYKEKPLRPAALPEDLSGLVSELASPNLTRRMLAMNAIADRFGQAAVKVVEDAAARPANPYQQAHALWLLHRLEALPPDVLLRASRSEDRLVRVHAQRIANSILYQDSLGGLGTGETDTHHIAAAHQIATEGLKDKDALVQRCAAEAIARCRVTNSTAIVRSLLDLLATVPADDTHLRYVVRKSIRDQLRVGQVFDLLVKENLNARDQNVLTDVALGVTNAAAATFLLRQLPELSRAKNPQPPIADILKHAARYAPGEELDRLADFAGRRLPAAPGLEQRLELERQFALFKSIDDGLQQRGLARPEAIRVWGTNLVWTFFSALDGGQPWSALPHEAGPAVALWDLETRRDADGRTRQLISSLPHGESQTGILCSPEFPLPPRLSFWLCGHDGFPDQPPKRANLVRLRLVPERGVNAAPLGDVLASAPVPRHDVARRVTWELPAHAGQGVVLEAVDGDTGAAYAWLAFGDFEPALPQLRPAEFAPRRLRDGFAAAADAAVRLQMRETAPVLARFATPAAGSAAAQLDGETLGAMARAFVALAADQAVPALARALTAGQGPAAYREGLADLLASQNSPAAQAAVLAAMKTLPLAAQEKVAITLASAKFSAETLLGGIESGAIAPRVLHRHSVINRLKASQPRDWEARVRKLTASLAPQDEARDRLIASRRAGYDPAKADPVQGSRLFVTHCAACHQIDGRGGLVGPQLNGIGQRGLERLVEDVLDPNRNVDHAFRTTLLELKDGELTSGLFRREEGELVVLADSTGRELSVAKKDIAARSLSGTSLMPENFGELLSAEDFNHLMAFLLAQRVRP